MNSLITFLRGIPLAGKGLFISLSALFAVLISMKAALLGLFILISIDLLTGIRKNLYSKGKTLNPLKRDFWASIKSYLLRNTWRKTYEYVIGIVAISILESLILGGVPVTLMGKVFSVTELTVVIPALVEVWSIGENLEAVSGRNPLKRLLPLMPRPIRLLFEKKKKD